ncbi:hypothetical protein ACFU6R_03350 [Streptomyces sp. NPDC057499]|uniref:hypothetical protein n=1 Tax=Streptomyces sp. NPDC057499 TaxID=3346150 RepID=UPI0036883F6A
MRQVADAATTEKPKRAPRKPADPLTKLVDEIKPLIARVPDAHLRDVPGQARGRYRLRAEAWADHSMKAGGGLDSALMANASDVLAQDDPAELRQALLHLAAVALAKVRQLDGAGR